MVAVLLLHLQTIGTTVGEDYSGLVFKELAGVSSAAIATTALMSLISWIKNQRVLMIN